MATVVGNSEFRGDPGEAAVSPVGRVDTSLVLCLACGLIVNSHLEQYWPRSYLAFDGLLGNSLFYMLSGFGIGSSLLARPQRFGPYLARRLARIYPAVIVTGLVFLAIAGGHAHASAGGASLGTVQNLFERLVWPTPFTYVRNIIAIYVIGYCVALPRSARFLNASIAVAIGIFLVACFRDCRLLATDARLNLGGVPAGIYDAFDIALFLGGMMLCRARPDSSRRPGVLGLLAIALFIAYCALKYAMVVMGVAARFYPLLFLLVAAISYLAVRVLSAPAVVGALKRGGGLSGVVNLVASHTLEIYVVHQSLIGGFPALATIPFPLNIVVLVLASVAAAMLLQRVTEPLRKRVDDLTTAGRPAGASPSA